MKAAYLILLVVVGLEAGLSMWPESFAAAADGATMVVEPAAKKGKNNRKIRRTIRLVESAPLSAPGPSPAAPAVAAVAPPVQPVPQQAAQPINNEVHINPDISVQVSPNQQQHHPQQPQQQPQQHQQPTVVHVQAPPALPSPQPIVVQKPQQQQPPIVELPDDDGNDDDEEEDEVDNDEDKADDEQIEPDQPEEQSILPQNPVSQLIEAGADQAKKLLVKPAGDLLEQLVPVDNGQKPTETEIVHLDGAQLTDSDTPHANVINRRYHPLGWPLFHPANVVTAPGSQLVAGQVPVIQVNIDEQFRQPWLASAAAPVIYGNTVAAPTTLLPSGPSYVSAPAATPIWQSALTAQPAINGFYPASPVGAVLPPAAAANFYQPPAVYQAADPWPMEAPRYYGSRVAALNQQPLMVQAPMMAAPMVQQQPIMMQPIMMLPGVRSEKPRRRKHPKKKKVVVEVEEPAAEEKTTWVKKEPQFNQYVEKKPQNITTKVVEVKAKEEPEEIEWETVRIPKIKKNTAAGQQ